MENAGVSNVLNLFPELQSIASQLECVFVCQEVAEMFQEDKESAFAALASPEGRNWSKETIEEAFKIVAQTLGEIQCKIISDFGQSSGAGETGTEEDFDSISKRCEIRLAFENSLIEFSTKLIESIMKICGQLGLANPDPGEYRPESLIQPLPVATFKQEPVKENLLHKLASQFVKIEDEEPDVIEQPLSIIPAVEKPGWENNPVLPLDSTQAIAFNKFIVTWTEKSPDAETAKKRLATLGFPEKRISELIVDLAKKARKQTWQSKEIIKEITLSFEALKEKVAQIQQVLDSTLESCRFYFPK